MNPSHVRPGVTILACLLVFVFLGRAGAEIPQLISYQGKVTDSDGTPVADDTYTMRFRIYDAVTGGIMEWDSGDRSIAVSDGVFNVILGESPQPTLNLPFDEDYWLLVRFDGVDQSPRQRLTSAGYAYMASGLAPGTLIEGSVTTGTYAAIKGVNTATSGTNSGVTGLSASTSGRGVRGEASAATGHNCGVYGLSASTYGKGVQGWATATTGTNCGVTGLSSSTSGKGVYGEAMATTGTTYGGEFKSASTSGKGVYAYAPHTGVYGKATATTGASYGGSFISNSQDGKGIHAEAPHTGVYGKATATTGEHYGGSFVSNSSSGRGVHGQAPHTGVYGKATATTGVGVQGYASATTGTTYGGWFESAATSGKGIHGEAPYTGVYGKATATTGASYGGSFVSNSQDGKGIHAEAPHTGVYGKATATTGEHYGGSFISNSPDGRGIYAEAPHIGVYGYASATSGLAYGVYGRSNSSMAGVGVRAYASANTGVNYALWAEVDSPAGFAGLFDGDVHVSGSINKSACSFLIDHPLDPENRLLRHNCMESPEHLVVYRGKVRLDADGEAAVQMPEYFTAIAKEDEATIHLTAQGRPFITGYAWSADHTAFTAYGKPNREVSWMVMAERDDPVIRRLARPVEEEKGPDNKFCDRGKLLDPTAYGYPESMGRDYEIFPPSNVHPVEEPEDWRPTGAGEPVKPDRTSEDVDVMEVGDAR